MSIKEMDKVLDKKILETRSTDEFLNDLVASLTGYQINELEESSKNEIVLKCVNIFDNFLFDYIEKKYDKRDVIRLKSVQIFEDPTIFDRFPDLEAKYLDAFKVFLESIN